MTSVALSSLAVAVEVLAMPGAYSLVEQANLPALAVSLRFKALWDEVMLLQRVAYKNHNQHRASKHHQAVRQVLKVLQHFQQLQLPDVVQPLHSAAQRTALPEALPQATATAAGIKRARRSRQQAQQQLLQVPTHTGGSASAPSQRLTLRLPSFSAGCFALRRLLSGVHLLLDLHPALLTAAQHLSGQLSRGYFMPYCLVATAALARIRVLATSALLDTLQAYNSLVPLLPLLLHAPAAANPASSSSERLLQFVSGAELPQMLQLAWSGPLPALRSIAFEASGPHSLAGKAEELRQAYCITSAGSSSSNMFRGVNSAPASTPSVPDSAAAGAAAATVDARCLAVTSSTGPDLDAVWTPAAAAAAPAAAAVAAAGGGSDLGVAVSREAFALRTPGQPDRPQQEQQQQVQLYDRRQQQQQEQQRQQGRQLPPRQVNGRAAVKQQQQQPVHSTVPQAAPVVSISVFEDKQPGPVAAAAAMQGTPTGMQQQQQEPAGGPCYTTVPGLGLSLSQLPHPAPRLQPLTTAYTGVLPAAQQTLAGAATAAAADDGVATGAAAGPLGCPAPAVAATAAAAEAPADAMEVDRVLQADDADEYLLLYGCQPTRPAHQQHHQQHQQQLEQQQAPRPRLSAATPQYRDAQGPDQAAQLQAAAAAPAAAVAGHPAPAAAAAAAAVVGHAAPAARGHLRPSAALLAMQGADSSDTDEDMTPAPPLTATATTVAATLRPAAPSTAGAAPPVPSAAAVAQQRVDTAPPPPQQQQQEQEQALLFHKQKAAEQPAVLQQQQQQRVSAAAPPGPVLESDTVPAGVAAPSHTAPTHAGSSRAGPTATALGAKKGKQRKKRQQQQQPRPATAGDPAAAASRDTILDMLLQGL